MMGEILFTYKIKAKDHFGDNGSIGLLRDSYNIAKGSSCKGELGGSGEY